EWTRHAGARPFGGKPWGGHHRVGGVRHPGGCGDFAVLSPPHRAVFFWRGGEHSAGTLAGRGAPLDWAELGPGRPDRDLLVGSSHYLSESWVNPRCLTNDCSRHPSY